MATNNGGMPATGLTIGETYTAWVGLTAEPDAPDVTFGVEGLGALSPFAIGDDVVHAMVEFVATATEHLLVITPATVAPGLVYADEWICVAGSTYSGDYFDGDMPGAWWGAGAWRQKFLDDAVIANLDAGKITVGTLAAERIGADTITAEKLAANAVLARNIAALQVEAGHLKASAVTADKIDAGAVTAVKVAADAIDTSKLSADAITAKHTITGALIRTAASGARTEMTNAGIRTLDSSGNELVKIGYGITNGMAVRNPSSGVLTPLANLVFGASTMGPTVVPPYDITNVSDAMVAVNLATRRQYLVGSFVAVTSSAIVLLGGKVGFTPSGTPSNINRPGSGSVSAEFVDPLGVAPRRGAAAFSYLASKYAMFSQYSAQDVVSGLTPGVTYEVEMFLSPVNNGGDNGSTTLSQPRLVIIPR